MAQVVWTKHAREDLKDLVSYISRDSKVYALSFAKRILDRTTQLSRFPESGPIIEELPEGPIRHLLVSNYRILNRPSA